MFVMISNMYCSCLVMIVNQSKVCHFCLVMYVMKSNMYDVCCWWYFMWFSNFD